MTIVVFLIDTSASMNQHTYLGTSLLDTAKSAVENFIKLRSRDQASKLDRYILLTFDDPPENIKAGWKESIATFNVELKNLAAFGVTCLGNALKYTFDMLNINRMHSGVDTYGQGRCPFYMEPAIIMCLTDGRSLVSPTGVSATLQLPGSSLVPGAELTQEPFRWDQRLYGLVLRFPAVAPPDPHSNVGYIPVAVDSPIDAMCDVTGGRSYLLTSKYTLNQCLESLVQKVQPGVVVNFEKIGPDPPSLGEPVTTTEDGDNKTTRCDTPNATWHSCRKLIYVHKSAQKGYTIGTWPIPESYWPDINSPRLPSRPAQPIIHFECTPHEPRVVENFPFDKYELEPSPLTRYILERKQPNVCWQVYVMSSGKYGDMGQPFGYLKPSTQLTSVNLFVHAYNYPLLLNLTDELIKVHKCKPPDRWKSMFHNYLKAVPSYYYAPLNRAFAKTGAIGLIPDESCLNYSVVSYLKRLKNQAKVEHERTVAAPSQRTPRLTRIPVVQRTAPSLLQRPDFTQLVNSSDLSVLAQQITDNATFTILSKDAPILVNPLRNPFDITRNELLSRISTLRSCLSQISSTSAAKLSTKLSVLRENTHNLPIHQMGNYHEHLQKMPVPLREIDDRPPRVHTFGNPWKANKNMMIDEADEAMPGQPRKRSSDSLLAGTGPNKRRRGPLPKGFTYEQWKATPPSSPAPHHTGDFGLRLDFNQLDESLRFNSPPPALSPTLLNGDVEILSPIPKSPEQLNCLYINDKKFDYCDVRRRCFKLLRRPGKDYEPLMLELKNIHGDAELKNRIIDDVITDALRFKKRTLFRVLTEFKKDMCANNYTPTSTLPVVIVEDSSL